MIIDIRSREKYLNGHLDGAIHIPFLELYSNPSKYLNKNKTYQIYCNSGSSSGMLVSYLNSLGYSCVNLDGGYSKHLFK